jgi:FlaA1/EpsC-like NDP-sugar epimerase/lipopolysaccharide/colanic/teichoic acid biosynthesis glycosyltransferase
VSPRDLPVRINVRLILINLADAVLLNAAVVAALALRFEGDIPPRFLLSLVRSASFYTLGILVLINLAGINRSIWRYAGIPTLVVLARTLFLGFALLFVVNLIPQVRLFPVSVVILSWILATGVIATSRLAWKLGGTTRIRGTRPAAKRILVVGAGDIGAMLAREMRRTDRQMGEPVGFADDDPEKLGRRIENLAVLGTSFDIPRILLEKKVGQVLIAAPSAPSRLVRQVVQFCQEAGVECRTVPALSDFIAGKEALGQVREVRIEDLLGREPVVIDFEGIAERVRGRTVLVTGAGGSIGSELCRQLSRFAPRRLVALDHCENRLCFLGLELGESFPDLALIQVVGDIRDEGGVHDLFRLYRPDIVFHAAAHKHVHFLERTPREAVLNNILATRNLARAATDAGVDTFVFISTDKAVNPSNVMGASKRACEILLQAMSGPGARTRFVAVRFGNVLGSDGSVIPIFQRQLAHGGPLTVTHPEVRRYFMTIPEASQLVIQAALFGNSGDVFVLDMGEQVRILDVAEQLIRLSGMRPGIDVSIRFIGLRPGEKLEEELLTDAERTRVTEHRKIFRLEIDPVDPPAVQARIDGLELLAHTGTPELIRTALAELVPEYRTFEPTPLPVEESVAGCSPVAATVAPVPPRRENGLRRTLEVAAAGILLVLLLPVVGILLLLYRLSGPAEVRFVREERIGQNRRSHSRRRTGAGVPIDRRYNDRRVRSLPGQPFISYQVELVRRRQSWIQRRLAGFLQRHHLDRVLLLWSVLRGEMSLVGPSARLVSEASFRQDWTSAWIYTRRPGLTGPGVILAGTGLDRSRADLYDGFYARYGGVHLDIETLLRAAGSLLRGEEFPRRNGDEEDTFEGAEKLTPARKG